MRLGFCIIAISIFGMSFADTDSSKVTPPETKVPKTDKANWSISKPKGVSISEQCKSEFQKLRERFKISQELQNQRERFDDESEAQTPDDNNN